MLVSKLTVETVFFGVMLHSAPEWFLGFSPAYVTGRTERRGGKEEKREIHREKEEEDESGDRVALGDVCSAWVLCGRYPKSFFAQFDTQTTLNREGEGLDVEGRSSPVSMLLCMLFLQVYTHTNTQQNPIILWLFNR